MSRGKAGEFSLEVGASQHEVADEIKRAVPGEFIGKT
jgi:hypothetical protein